MHWIDEAHKTHASLQLAPNGDPAARAHQQAIFEQGRPAAMFFTDDVKADYERIKARGANFAMPPTRVTGSTIAMLEDTCGNLIQLTELSWQGQHTAQPALLRPPCRAHPSIGAGGKRNAP